MISAFQCHMMRPLTRLLTIAIGLPQVPAAPQYTTWHEGSQDSTPLGSLPNCGEQGQQEQQPASVASSTSGSGGAGAGMIAGVAAGVAGACERRVHDACPVAVLIV